MSAADPRCATCQGRGVYRAGGITVECLCTRRGCEVCAPGEVCDACFCPVALHDEGDLAACAAERQDLALFERQMREQADGRSLDRAVGL